jgi:hypothetical protein
LNIYLRELNPEIGSFPPNATREKWEEDGDPKKEVPGSDKKNLHCLLLLHRAFAPV